ncbi:MAG: adenine deaminase [Ignavibacteria bacterium]|nr:adenine deaminase [Ignavibacteria bacterium]
MDNFKVSGNIVDIRNRKIFPGTVTVENGIIKDIIEDNGKYDNFIMPGFIDAHIHVESSMLIPSEFARLAVTHGTVATVSDPHEIANVLGKDGIKYMIENGNKVPFKFYFGAPSCVPATDFETSGAKLDAGDIEDLFETYDLKYLSEMMNYPGVLFAFPDVMSKIEVAKKFGKPIDGHAPGLKGEDAKKYVSAGISTDHECFTLDEALEKISYGMKILIREGSAAKNFEELHPLIKSNMDMIMLCSDDRHPDDLAEGHVNLIVKRAVQLGYDVFDVLRIACINPIEHYSLEVGTLRKGDDADFIVVDNLKDFNTKETYINGILVSKDGKTLIKSVHSELVNNFNIKPKHEKDFEVENKGGKIRVIETLEGQLITNELILEPKIEDGKVVSDIENDVLKITVIDRYNEEKPAVGFIKNFGLKKGAIASCVGHDSHNIIAIGADDKSLCLAVNSIIENKGGISVVIDGKAEVLPLPVAGIMSADDGFKVAEKYSSINKLPAELGCKLHSPYMTMSFMALLVIPSLKLSDKGLFDGTNFKFVDLFVR